MAGNSELRHALHMAIGRAISTRFPFQPDEAERATMDAVDAVLSALVAACPPETLEAAGLLEHIGWQSATTPVENMGLFVHKHFFDSWDDEIIAHHVNCNPVFVRKDR